MSVWTFAFPCGRRVFVSEAVSIKTPVWCVECARAYSEPCHRCNPCSVCAERRIPAHIARCFICRVDAELNEKIEAYRAQCERTSRRGVSLAEASRDLLWRGVNEATRWRHPPGSKADRNTAQLGLFGEPSEDP
jgi:hypothetical protein